MKIYANKNGRLVEVKPKAFKLERDIQRLFEDNLQTLMGLTLVRSEYTIKNKRIDTLAFDDQAGSFIIIEYKRDKNISVVDQGFTYLSLMLENKADFVVAYNEQFNKSMKMAEVDWSQTRVAFVSPSFTDNQVQATNFKDIGIELWEVQQFEDGNMSVHQIKQSNSATSIKPITQQSAALQKVANEIKVYSEADHANGVGADMFELYEKFRDAILNLADGIEVSPQKHYIALKKNGNMACIELQKRKLKIYIAAKIGTLDDPKGLAKDVSNIGHYGTGDYEVHASDDKDLEYIMSLVKQVAKG
jgi:predicted transport protein